MANLSERTPLYNDFSGKLMLKNNSSSTLDTAFTTTQSLHVRYDWDVEPMPLF